MPKSELEQRLEEAKVDLERTVMDALGARKGILDPQRKEQLKAEIWRRRMKVVELERDRIREQLMKTRHKAEEATTRQDYEEYLRNSQRTAGLRVRYLDAVDLLEKLQEDGPNSSARLLGGG